MTVLSTFVNDNFDGSMSVEEAEQLAFTIFCTLDYLPENLRAEIWNRARIADEFACLAQEGHLAAITQAHKNSEFWDSTITRFMSGELEVDYDLRARLKQ